MSHEDRIRAAAAEIIHLPFFGMNATNWEPKLRELLCRHFPPDAEAERKCPTCGEPCRQCHPFVEHDVRRFYEDAPAPPEVTQLSDPCPHPSRNGNHEVYLRSDGSQVCRACGATDRKETPDGN